MFQSAPRPKISAAAPRCAPAFCNRVKLRTKVDDEADRRDGDRAAVAADRGGGPGEEDHGASLQGSPASTVARATARAAGRSVEPGVALASAPASAHARTACGGRARRVGQEHGAEADGEADLRAVSGDPDERRGAHAEHGDGEGPCADHGLGGRPARSASRGGLCGRAGLRSPYSSVSGLRRRRTR